jgi:hypothetical protein
MSQVHPSGYVGRAVGSTGEGAAAIGAAGWLCLAPAPTFAIMALLTAVHGGGASDMLCSVAPGGSPLTGMVPMYVLMSAFHMAPWLRLLSAAKYADDDFAVAVDVPVACAVAKSDRQPDVIEKLST